MPEQAKIWVVLPAGGAGVRLGGDTRKQYVEIVGKKIMDHTLERFAACTWVAGIVLVVPEEDRPSFALSAAQRDLIKVVAGGPTRFHSVKKGVLALRAAPEDFIVVHDAVRPLFSEGLCLRVLEVAKGCGAAIAALPLSGTIKEANTDSAIARTVDRHRLWEAQTPQVFLYRDLCEAYDMAKTWSKEKIESVTDEAFLFEAMGKKVALVEGEATNIKITRPLDLRLVESLLKEI